MALRLSFGLVEPAGISSSGSSCLRESLDGRRVDLRGRRKWLLSLAEYKGLSSQASCSRDSGVA